MNIPKSTKVLINITLALLSIFLYSNVIGFINPVTKVLMFILMPLILSTYAYYALKPLKSLIFKFTKKEGLSSIITFLIFVIFFVLLFSLLGGLIVTQLRDMIINIDFSRIFQSNSEAIEKLAKTFKLEELFTKLETQLKDNITKIPKNITDIFSGVFSSISNIGTQVLLGFLAIFYFLKDEKVIKNSFNKAIQGRYHEELSSMGHQINKTLETYISGQLIVASILGGLMFIGFLLIKLPYAFLMAILALITNFIPFIGPILGAIPAVLIALTINWSMAIKVVVVSLIVQNLESNLITPNIMGSKLDIHPFVVIIVVLVCMNLFGIIGALIATPLYISTVILAKGIYKIYKKKMVLDSPKINIK